MAELLKGSLAVEKITEEIQEKVEMLGRKGVKPCLAVLRVGENPSDLSYEKGVKKKAELLGVEVSVEVLPSDVKEEDFFAALDELNRCSDVHGILMFRPLPEWIDEDRARNAIAPEKDIDGCSDASLGGIFIDRPVGYPPCTAEACIRILDAYGIDVKGKSICVIGRSLVIGKPVSMMLLNRNATVTVCHSKTANISETAKKSDILVSCIGKLHYVTEEFTNEGQTIVDVGINWNEKTGKIAGDVDFENVENKVKAITPVPGGVGGVTSAVLLLHTVDACIKSL